LRSLSPLDSNSSASRSAELTSDANGFHSMLRRCGLAFLDHTVAPAPSPNRQALINTPGSLSRYIAALLTSTQMKRT